VTAKGVVTAFVAAIALGMLSGCATIFSGGPETVNFTSTPPGATYEYGAYSGKTPNSAQIPRNALSNSASFTMPGYQSKTVPVSTGIQGATWFNLLFPIGFLVDFMSGDAYTVNDPNVNTYLTPVAAPAVSAPLSPAVQSGTQSASTCSTTQLSYPCAPCTISCAAGKRALCIAGSANALRSTCLTQASCTCQ